MDDAEDVTMWEPAYITKRGAREVRGRIRNDRFFPMGRSTYGRTIGLEVFTNQSDALKKAEEERQERIGSLQRTLAKAESVGPHYP